MFFCLVVSSLFNIWGFQKFETFKVWHLTRDKNTLDKIDYRLFVKYIDF